MRLRPTIFEDPQKTLEQMRAFPIAEKVKPIEGTITNLIGREPILAGQNGVTHGQILVGLLTEDGDPVVRDQFYKEGKVSDQVVDYDKIKDRVQKYAAIVKLFETGLTNQIADQTLRTAAYSAAYFANDPKAVVESVNENRDKWESGKAPMELLATIKTPFDQARTQNALFNSTLYRLKVTADSPNPEAFFEEVFGVEVRLANDQYRYAVKQNPEYDLAKWTTTTGKGFEINREKAVAVLRAMKVPDIDAKPSEMDKKRFKNFNEYIDRLASGVAANNPESMFIMQFLVNDWHKRQNHPEYREMTAQKAKEEMKNLDVTPTHFATDTVKMIFDSTATPEARASAAALTTLAVMTMFGKGPFKKLKTPLLYGGLALSLDTVVAEFNAGQGIFDMLGVTEAIRAAQGKESEVFRKGFLDRHGLSHGRDQFGILAMENLPVKDLLAWREAIRANPKSRGNVEWIPSEAPQSIKKIRNDLGVKFNLSKYNAGEMLNKLGESILIEVAESELAFENVDSSMPDDIKIAKGEEFLRSKHLKDQNTNADKTIGSVLDYYTVYHSLTEKALLVQAGEWVAEKTKKLAEVMGDQYYRHEAEIKAGLDNAYAVSKENGEKAYLALSKGVDYVRMQGFTGIFNEVKDIRIGDRTVEQIWIEEVKPHLDKDVIPALSTAGTLLLKLWQLPIDISLWGMGLFGNAGIPQKLTELKHEIEGFAFDLTTEALPEMVFKADNITSGTPELWWNEKYFEQYADEVQQAYSYNRPHLTEEVWYVVGKAPQVLTPEEAKDPKMQYSAKAPGALFTERAKADAIKQVKLLSEAEQRLLPPDWENNIGQYIMPRFQYEKDGNKFVGFVLRIPTAQKKANEGNHSAEEMKSFDTFLDKEIDLFLNKNNYAAILDRTRFPANDFFEGAAAIAKDTIGLDFDPSLNGTDAFRKSVHALFTNKFKDSDKATLIQNAHDVDKLKNGTADKAIQDELMISFEKLAFDTYLSTEIAKFVNENERRQELMDLPVDRNALIKTINKISQVVTFIPVVFTGELGGAKIFEEFPDGMKLFEAKVIERFMVEKNASERRKFIEANSGNTQPPDAFNFQRQLVDIYDKIIKEYKTNLAPPAPAASASPPSQSPPPPSTQP